MTHHSSVAASSTTASETPRNDIFISYCRRDKTFVQMLDTALRQADRDPWVDWEDIQPTEDWWHAIELGIEGANTFIFVISPDSVTSQVCRREVEYAISHNKRLVPLLWREGFSMDDVHPAISRHNWIFCRENDNFDQAFQKLIGAIATEIDYVHLHTQLLIRAKEWERKSHDRSFLLKGKGLEEAQQWLLRGETLPPHPTDLHRQYIQASQKYAVECQDIELRLRKMSPQQYRNRQALLNKVDHYWIKSVLQNSLSGQVLMDLNLTDRTDLIMHPWQITLESADAGSQMLQPGTRIVTLFDQLGEGRTLLILGAPGAGKTTLLLTLAQDLLARAERELDFRIPVVFNLSSWKGGKQTIAEWLIEELHTKYQVPEAIGQTWLDEQQLLLLLDGLDEVQAEKRNSCVAALNFFQQQSGAEMVVCSRLQDYETLTKRLNFQSAICVQALTLDQIHQYLNQPTAELSALKTLLERDMALQELARSPLMLNVMILAYQGCSVEQISDMDLDQRCQHLFDSFIERMFKRRGIDEPYDKPHTLYWLSWLAQRLQQESQTVFLIENLQPNWLQSGWQKTGYRVLVNIAIGVICGLAIGMFSKVVNYSLSIPLGLQVGSLAGFFSGLITGLLHQFYSKSNSGIVAGITASALFGFVSLMLGSPQPLNLLIFGLVFGIILTRVNYQKIEAVDVTQWSWRQGKRIFLVSGLWGLIAGLFLLVARAFLSNFHNQYCQSSQVLAQWAGSVLINFLCQPDHRIGGLAVVGLLALSLMVGSIVCLILGFEKVLKVEQRTRPNQGIWNSALNMVKLMFIVGPLTGLISFVFWQLYFYSAQFYSAQAVVAPGVAVNSPLIWWIYYGNSLDDGLGFGGSVGLMVGLFGGLVSGDNSGLVCLQHVILRMVLWRYGYIPWNQVRFLNYATERVFLQKVGSGYIFTHRLLLEHFAQMKSYKL